MVQQTAAMARRPGPRPRFPRRSREIRLGLLLAVAAGLLACERRRCLDANDLVVPDENCQNLTPDGGGPGPLRFGAHWLYYGRSYFGRSFYSGGSYGSGSHSSSSVSRGGFGHAGGAHGGS
jgi:hypothetical protein